MASKQPSHNEKRNISEIMRKVSSSDTKPELLLCQALQVQKIQYQVNNMELPGKPDLVFPKARVAVFVDGDFWHGGQWRKRKLAALEEQFTENKNKEYWLKKIRRNMDRDCKVTADLLLLGWTVLRFWERDIEKRLEECVGIIVAALADDCTHSGYHPLSVIPRCSVAEFWAGIGFMRTGLEKEGWKVAFANEPDPEKRRMYEGHFGSSERFFGEDVQQIPGGVVPEVTLATAALPGNDRAGVGSHRKQISAFWEFIRIIGEMEERRPPFVLLECGVGLLASHDGNDLKEALGALNNLGYQVDVFILDAARFVPLSRKSLFVLGLLDSIGTREVQEPDRNWESEFRPKPLVKFIVNHPEIHWRIRDLPACPKREMDFRDIVEEVPEDSKIWWSAERTGYLFGQMSLRSQAAVSRMMNQGEYGYGMLLRHVRFGESRVELRTDGLVGNFRTLRGGEQVLFKAGKGRYFVRQLTPREWARLMGADEFQITVPFEPAAVGFEDAVCPPVIQWIARYYLNPLVTELLRGSLIRPGMPTGRDAIL